MAGSQDYEADRRNGHLLAYVDGALVPAAEASISIFDAGFGLGDGVWEGLRLHRGALLFLRAHLDRLYAGASAIRIDIGLDRDALASELRRLVRANGMVDGAHLRLMVTRGRKPTINQDPRTARGRATIVVTAEYKKRSIVAPGGGLILQTTPIRASGPDVFDMTLNSHSRLNYIRALIAVMDSADEAVMLDPNGHVSSCNATNLFWVKDGVVHTSGDRYCFNGITRAHVIGLCRDGLAPLAKGDWPVEHLHGADEAFVTGTMGGITPVARVDGHALPGGGAPLTTRIAAAYEALKDADAAAQPLP